MADSVIEENLARRMVWEMKERERERERGGEGVEKGGVLEGGTPGEAVMITFNVKLYRKTI